MALPLSHRLQSVFAFRVQALPPSVRELLLLAALDGTGELRLIRAITADREEEVSEPNGPTWCGPMRPWNG